MPKPGRDLISRRTRRHFREHFVGEYLATIADMFEDEGFLPTTPRRSVSGQRRQAVEEYYASVDWTDSRHISRLLRVFEQALRQMSPDQYRDQAIAYLKDDGFTVIDGRIVRDVHAVLPEGSLSDLGDAEVIEQHLQRIGQSMDADPAQAIGAAKELIESTTKLVLRTLDVAFDPKADVPVLVRQAQKALGLHPDAIAGEREGAETIKRLMQNLSQVAVGVAELRNVYGTGHGRDRKPNLKPRHAHLAVGCAATFCRLLLETLQDPDAPWRTQPARQAD